MLEGNFCIFSDYGQIIILLLHPTLQIMEACPKLSWWRTSSEAVWDPGCCNWELLQFLESFCPAIRIFNEPWDCGLRFTLIGELAIFRGSRSTMVQMANSIYARVRPFIASGSLFSMVLKLKNNGWFITQHLLLSLLQAEIMDQSQLCWNNHRLWTITSQVTPDGEVDLGKIVITETRQPSLVCLVLWCFWDTVCSWTLCC